MLTLLAIHNRHLPPLIFHCCLLRIKRSSLGHSARAHSQDGADLTCKWGARRLAGRLASSGRNESCLLEFPSCVRSEPRVSSMQPRVSSLRKKEEYQHAESSSSSPIQTIFPASRLFLIQPLFWFCQGSPSFSRVAGIVFLLQKHKQSSREQISKAKELNGSDCKFSAIYGYLSILVPVFVFCRSS